MSDPDNYRVQKFDSAGNFLRAWGKDVDSGGGTGFEVCTVAASCKAGASGGLGGELISAYGIGADGAGNVYVAENFANRVQKFAADPPAPPPATGSPTTGQRAAALKKCKKQYKKHHNKKKSKKKASKLPV